jgi:hypothetical protein
VECFFWEKPVVIKGQALNTYQELQESNEKALWAVLTVVMHTKAAFSVVGIEREEIITLDKDRTRD